MPVVLRPRKGDDRVLQGRQARLNRPPDNLEVNAEIASYRLSLGEDVVTHARVERFRRQDVYWNTQQIP